MWSEGHIGQFYQPVPYTDNENCHGFKKYVLYLISSMQKAGLSYRIIFGQET